MNAAGVALKLGPCLVAHPNIYTGIPHADVSGMGRGPQPSLAPSHILPSPSLLAAVQAISMFSSPQWARLKSNCTKSRFAQREWLCVLEGKTAPILPK